MKTYDYAFRFAKEGDGWVITCRDLPEAISQADANEDRIAVAEGCLQAALESRIRDNESLPVASKSRRGEVMISPPAANNP
jgi:antitoxin HicB